MASSVYDQLASLMKIQNKDSQQLSADYYWRAKGNVIANSHQHHFEFNNNSRYSISNNLAMHRNP